MSRRLAGLLLAVLAATGLLVAPSDVADVRAVAPNLTIVADARYDVQPDQHRVHVTVDMVVTNHLRDTRTTRYYYDRAVLSVLPGSTGFKLTGSGASSPRAKVSKKTSSYSLVQLDLGRRLYSGKSAIYRLVFDMVDTGGAASRDIRVGGALVSFPVWAYATDQTAGSTVRITFPAGYHVEVRSGDLPAPTTAANGATTYQTGKLGKPLAFVAYLVADRPGAYTEHKETVIVAGTPVDLTIRAWVDESAWSERVSTLVAGALPRLTERIGLPWPRTGGLAFEETASRTTGGYAGLFDPSLGQVQVAYDADDFVVLHESAHTWFNGALLADRWANEAFASYYGLAIAPDLKVKATADTLTPALEAARIPLNAWGAIGKEDQATEDYAYAATLALARAIAERAGDDRLRAVWADAAAKVGAYQPPAPGSGSSAAGADDKPETVAGPPDWRGLLDLLEAETGDAYEDLWREWVTRDVDLPLLDARAEARTRYDQVVAAAGDWQLPRTVRDAMRAWHFDQARTLLSDADAILTKRAAIAKGALAAGLIASPILQTAFEGPDGFATATIEADAELEAIDRYEAASVAAAGRPGTLDLLETVGLWGSSPDVDLERARTLFEAGDSEGSTAASSAVAAAWSGAEDIGRGRIVSVALLALALVFAMVLLVRWRQGRTERVSGTAVVAAPDSYATLAASADPTEPLDVGDDGARGAVSD